MTFHAKVQARFEELIEPGEKIKETKFTVGGQSGTSYSFPETFLNAEQACQWTMSVLMILKSSLGADNDNYKLVKENLECCNLLRNFCIILSSLKAALDDLKRGFFFRAKTLLEAEVFSDFLEQAEVLFRAGYKDAAAVIGGSILEKQMRSMCVNHGIDLLNSKGKPKMINEMNDELAKAEVYNMLKKKQVTAWADLRNNAAHGNWEEYNLKDVEAFLRDILDFCANFS